jgi:hypothetical protein
MADAAEAGGDRTTASGHPADVKQADPEKAR